MTCIKGLYIWTDQSQIGVLQNIHAGMLWIIEHSYIFPIHIFWNEIPYIPFEGNDMLQFYKAIIQPAAVFTICALFISDHRSLKAKFNELKAEIEKEIALRDMRKEAGIETVSENATVDIVISSAVNTDPSWHDTWWGKVVIGVAIALVVAAFGLK